MSFLDREVNMVMRKNFDRPSSATRNSEQGIFIPLVAAVVTGVLGLLILLSVDTALIRKARIDLYRKAEQICDITARSTSNYEQLPVEFARQVSATLANDYSPRIALASATLTVPDLLCPDLSQSNCTSYPYALPYCPTPPYNPIPFENLCAGRAACSVPECHGPDGGDFHCFLRRWQKQSDSVATGWTSTIWSEVLDPGTSIGCTLTAHVFSLSYDFFGRSDDHAAGIVVQIIKSRRARELDLKGAPQIEVSPSTNLQEIIPHWTVAVAPEMTTSYSLMANPILDSYLFFQRDLYPPELRNFFDVRPRDPGDPDPPGPYPVLQGFKRGNPHRRDPNIPDGKGNKNGYLPGWPYYDASLTPPPWLDPAVTDELALSCMNPPVLIRNLFLSTILELMSRNESMRWKTEVLLVNPQPVTTNYPSTKINYVPHSPPEPPTLIVQDGQDLSSPQFQIPYISAFHDTGTKPEFGAPVDTWQAPMAEKLSEITPEKSYTSFFGSQLRMCYHLYSSYRNSTLRGFPRPSLSGITDDPYGLLPRFDYSYRYGFFSSLYGKSPQDPQEYNPATGTMPWDQDFPFGCTDLTLPRCPGDYTRYLTAAEVVSAMGSVQSCIEGAAPGCDRSKVLLDAGGAVEKSLTVPLHDLHPDIVGLVKYLYQVTGYENLHLQPFSNPEGVPCSIREKYMLRLLYFTHRPVGVDFYEAYLARKTAYELFRQYLGPTNFSFVLTIFLPTTVQEASVLHAAEFDRMFSRDDLNPPPNGYPPYNPSAGTIMLAPSCAFDVRADLRSNCKPDDLAKYWADLLNPASPQYIVKLATRVFYERMLRTQTTF